MSKKIFAMMIAVIMVVGMLPMSVFAEDEYVAQIGSDKYTDIREALKALKSNDTLELLNNITIDYEWDARNYTGDRYCHAKITYPVTIDGKGFTMKFTGQIDDGGNYHAVFRTEANVTFKNLTIDLSEATPGELSGTRIRAISAKGNLTVDNCTFIGNGAENNTRAIIFGEGSGTSIGDVEVSINNSRFSNWRRGLGDNENYGDVKTVTVTESTFTNADVVISAAEEITFSDNTMNTSWVDIYSNATNNKLEVTAENNNLEKNTSTKKNSIEAKSVQADEEFALPESFAGVEVNGVKYGSLAEAITAAQAGDTVKLTSDITITDAPVWKGDYWTSITVSKKITLDLNGKTLKSTSGSDKKHYTVIFVDGNGDLTITDTSVEKTGKIINAAETVANNSMVAVLYNHGKLTVSGGTLENQVSDSNISAYVIDSTTVKNKSGIITSLTINKGAKLVTTNSFAIVARSQGSVALQNITVNGGEIDGGMLVYLNLSGGNDTINLEINDGTFKSNENSDALYIYSAIECPETGSDNIVEINGGIFDGDVIVSAKAETYISKFINGGQFSNDVSEYCKEDYLTIEIAPGVWVLTKEGTVIVKFANADTASVSVDIGSPVAKPEEPTRFRYIFDGWYVDAACTEKYDFTKPVIANITLYAKWVDDTELNNRLMINALTTSLFRNFSVRATANEGGTLTNEGLVFTMFNNRLTYKATPNEGYEVVSFIVDGVDLGPITEYKFDRITANHTVEVVFAPIADDAE